MSFKKKILAVAAVGALSVATAVPAMALENDFHGSYKLKYFVSDYEQGGSGFLIPDTTKAKSGLTAANYFEQRARIFYTAKANDDLKLVTGFEIDSVFGDKSQGSLTSPVSTAFRNSGGALEADAVNLETKWVYLDFKIPSTPVNVKAGIQPYKDSLKGVLLDADIAGIYASSSYGNAKTAIAYFRPYELLNVSTGGNGSLAGNGAPARGTDNFDFAVLEGKYSISKDLTVGGAYYLYSDYRTSAPTTIHTFGVNAEAKVGPATISGFAAYQAGFNKGGTGIVGGESQTISAFAANVTGVMAAGPGKAKASFLYTSGDEGGAGTSCSAPPTLALIFV